MSKVWYSFEMETKNGIYASPADLLQVFTENHGAIHIVLDRESLGAEQIEVINGRFRSIDELMSPYKLYENYESDDIVRATQGDAKRRGVVIDPSTGARAYDVACYMYAMRNVNFDSGVQFIFPEDGMVLDKDGFRSGLAVDARAKDALEIGDASLDQEKVSVAKKMFGMHAVTKIVEAKITDRLNSILTTGDKHQQRPWESKTDWWLRVRNGKDGLPKIHWFAIAESSLNAELEDRLRKLNGTFRNGNDERIKMMVKMARQERRIEQREKIATKIRGLIGRNREADV